jgi:hypothetical protein
MRRKTKTEVIETHLIERESTIRLWFEVRSNVALKEHSSTKHSRSHIKPHYPIILFHISILDPTSNLDLIPIL